MSQDVRRPAPEPGAETGVSTPGGDLRWANETLHRSFQFSFAIERVLTEVNTGEQRLVLFENARFGRVLMLDGVTQVTTADEFIYHEMLAHVPLLAHGDARRVLVIGGGDGGTVREVLKHRGVEQCVLVEIDEGVVTFSKEHLPGVSAGAFDDARLELVIADGCRYVAETADRFDVVIVDSTDPIGPGAVLFTEDFYRDCHGCLTPGGVLVTQNGVPFVQPDELVASVEKFRRIFAAGTCYLATVPTYIGGPMALGFATDDAGKLGVSESELATRLARCGAGEGLRYYTPAVHRAAFALPRYVEAALE